MLGASLCLADADVTLDQASDIATDTTNFDGKLSSSDTDVQKSLDTLDDLTETDPVWTSDKPSYATVASLDGYFRLDQSTPQTVAASPVLNWGTANRIPYYSATKTLTDSANLTYNGTTLANSITSTRTTPGQDMALGANVAWNGASNSHALTRMLGFAGAASVSQGNTKNLGYLYGLQYYVGPVS